MCPPSIYHPKFSVSARSATFTGVPLVLRGEMNKHITYQGADYAYRILEISNRMIRELNDAGAGLLLGTDVQNPFVFPGFSVHEELQYMVDVGLTPYQAIRTGTRNAESGLVYRGRLLK